MQSLIEKLIMISAVGQNGISEIMTGKQQIISRTHSPYNSAVWQLGKQTVGYI